MSYKFNIIDGFSKGFFGSTMMAGKRPMPVKLKPSNLNFDSVDDFNKHFHKLVAEHRDTVVLSKKAKSDTSVVK